MMFRRRDKGFLVSGLLAGLVVWALVGFHLLRWTPWLAALADKREAVGWLARLVLFLAVWVWFFAVVRWYGTGLEMTLVRVAQAEVPSLGSSPDLDRHLRRRLNEYWRQFYDASRLRERLKTWSLRLHDHNRSDRLSFLAMGRSGLEAAHVESIYGPVHALVWALPSLGFMGTAMEMARAVQAVGQGGRAADAGALVAQITSEVIPALGGAFQITLLALGSSVVCFLVLSLLRRREERVLHAADALCLELLARLNDDPPRLLLNDDTARYLGSGLRDLRTVLQMLQWEIHNIATVAASGLADGEDA